MLAEAKQIDPATIEARRPCAPPSHRPRSAGGADRRSASAATSCGPSASSSTLAGAGRIHGHDSAGRHRRGAQGSARALGRLPKYIDTEIANLREGLKAGYTAPKGNVRIVIDQMNTLIATPIAESPFDSPSVRDKTPEFKKAFDRW